MSEIKKRIMFLIEEIDRLNYEYHSLNKNIVTDQQYDALLQELIDLEKKYPEYKYEFSPSNKVGGPVSLKFEKFFHTTSMLSLNNVFNVKDLKNFYDKHKNNYKNLSFITELKIDGLAISLIYKKGILERAVTRGDGFQGEVITNNAVTIKQIPIKLKQELDLEVRGEVYMPYFSFKTLNENRKKLNQSLFSNPRNAAAGTLRNLDSKVVANRNLSVFIYSIVKPPSFIHTQKEILEFLKKLGFAVNPYYKHIFTFEQLMESIEYYNMMRQKLDYNTDGVVVKVNELSLQTLIGYTSRAPKWAIAYKFQLCKAQSVVKNIFFQIGRTGIFTPVAEIIPTIIDGSLISKVTLHNYSYIQNKDIRIGDFVLIQKSGDVIPEIVEVIKTKRNEQKPFVMILNCFSCGEKLLKKGVNYFCVNNNCLEQKIQKIFYFVSKEAMNISSVGFQTLSQLFKKGFISNISDLYSLHNYKDQIKKINGFGDKKINNILMQIEKSKNNCLSRFLVGIGIKNVGLQLSQVLSKEFKSIDNLQNASLENLVNINDIGIQTANYIVNFFLDDVNRKEIINFKKNGLSLVYKKHVFDIEENIFKNKKVVLSGIFKNYSRNELKDIIMKLDGIIMNNISSKTNYLIVGDNPGSKLTKAKKNNVKVIDQNEFEKNINADIIYKNF